MKAVPYFNSARLSETGQHTDTSEFQSVSSDIRLHKLINNSSITSASRIMVYFVRINYLNFTLAFFAGIFFWAKQAFAVLGECKVDYGI